ncbi:hypothetical protein LTR86_005270 [Recurvomyces mirabilis]|nr:hypothetical protein LTR86_005270 [Recurvomyces mirabilis]
MTSYDSSAFCQLPCPALAGPAPGPNPDLHRSEGFSLAAAWECTLFHIRECRMYDGTKESKQKFEDATGIKPMRFAQAWLEEPGSRWRFFHFDYKNPRLAPAAAATGPQLVAQRLVELWAAKTKHWRTLSNSETKPKIVARVGQAFFEHEQDAATKWPTHIMSINGNDHEEYMLIRALRTIGSHDCVDHPGTLCKCKAAIDIPVLNDITGKRSGFLTGWCVTIQGCDNAFEYTGDTQSATLFKVRQNLTVEKFASAFLDGGNFGLLWTPAKSKEDLVKAMLALWAAHVRGWRSTCKTRREARTRYHEELKSSGLLRIVEDETGVQHALNPHKKNNDDDPLCRYVRVPGKEKGHEGTAVLYAKTEKGGGAGYQLLEFRPCHQECPEWKRVEIDLHEATGQFLEEDMARARLVRAEW